MKRITSFTIFFMLVFIQHLMGQASSPSFKNQYDTIFVKEKDTILHVLHITSNGQTGNFSLVLSNANQLAAADFTEKFGITSVSFSASNTSHSFLVMIHPANGNAYGKTLIYELRDAGNKIVSAAYIRLEKTKKQIDVDNYRLLIGTNFDFIDGVDAVSPYYHLQIVVPKGFSKKIGFMGGIQRNRQVSYSDTLHSKVQLSRGSVPYRLNSIQQRDSLFEITQVDSPQFKRTVSANALVIYFEPMLRLFPVKDEETVTQLYLFGHLDLVYRRNKYTEEYSYTNQRQVLVKADSLSYFRTIPSIQKSEENIYTYHYGGGLMMHHNNRIVEIYAKIMLGKANTNIKEWLGYFGTEVGVREKSLNIILGAEYRGFSQLHRPTYLNVYLSKVFPLDKLVDRIK